MKTLLFVTACAVSAPAFSQSGLPDSNSAFLQNTATTNTVRLLDSVINYNSWNSTTNGWNSALKSVYYYNAFYKEEAEYIYSLAGSIWQNSQMAVNYTYDANHNILQKIYDKNVGNIWSQDRRNTYTYDSSNNILTSLQQINSGGSWLNQSNIIYTYSGNHQTSYTYQSWNSGTATWDNVSRRFYIYNSNDTLISQTAETWSSGAWVNNTRSINYVYTGGDLTAYETESWNTSLSAYEPGWKTFNTYNTNHQILNSRSVKWNAITASWDNDQNNDFTYAPNGTIASLLLQTWNATLSGWQNQFKTLYYYRAGYVGLNEFSAEKSNLNISPNPCGDQLTLSLSGNEVFSSVIIRDLSGKTVLTYEPRQAGHFRIGVGELRPGMYFVEVNNEQGSSNAKFIKN